MGKLILDMAVSLDGFVGGANGQDVGLHGYFFAPSPESALVVESDFSNTGAIIMGRAAYELAADYGGYEDNPYQVPTFVIASTVPAQRIKGAESFVFVTDGIESAARQAKAAAGDRYAVLGGGATTAQAFIRAGLLDQIHLHVVPGAGRQRHPPVRLTCRISNQT